MGNLGKGERRTFRERVLALVAAAVANPNFATFERNVRRRCQRRCTCRRRR